MGKLGLLLTLVNAEVILRSKRSPRTKMQKIVLAHIFVKSGLIYIQPTHILQ